MKLTRNELERYLPDGPHSNWFANWNRNATSVVLSIELFNEYFEDRYHVDTNFNRVKDFMKTHFDIEIQSERFDQWGHFLNKIEPIS